MVDNKQEEVIKQEVLKEIDSIQVPKGLKDEIWENVKSYAKPKKKHKNSMPLLSIAACIAIIIPIGFSVYSSQNSHQLVHSTINHSSENGARPPLFAIRYNVKPNLYYIYHGEKVRNVGKLITTIHNGGQKDGWYTSSMSDSFEIYEIPGIDINKAVAVKMSPDNYIKIVAMTKQSYEKKYYPQGNNN